MFHTTFSYVEITQKHISRRNLIFQLIRDTGNPGIDFTNFWIDGTVKWSGIPISRDLKTLIINRVPRPYSNAVYYYVILVFLTNFTAGTHFYRRFSVVDRSENWDTSNIVIYCINVTKISLLDLVWSTVTEVAFNMYLTSIFYLDEYNLSLFLGERRISQLNYFFFLKTSVVSMCQMWAVI